VVGKRSLPEGFCYRLLPAARLLITIRGHTQPLPLGFAFLPGGAAKLKLDPQAVARVKATIRRLTRRSRSQNMSRRIQALNEYLRGWIDYFALAETTSVFDDLEEWVRRRLRLCLWRQWRRPRTRYRELRRRGVSRRDARMLASTRQAPWRIAGKALGRVLDTAFWTAQGLESVTAQYTKLRAAW
jgi:hypothetical protein